MGLRERFGKRSAGQDPESWGALLPWYLNDSLAPPEQESVDAWLRNEPGALAELATWAKIQRDLTGQPAEVPSPLVWQKVSARVRNSPARRQSAPLFRLAWDVAVAATVLLAL